MAGIEDRGRNEVMSPPARETQSHVGLDPAFRSWRARHRIPPRSGVGEEGGMPTQPGGREETMQIGDSSEKTKTQRTRGVIRVRRSRRRMVRGRERPSYRQQ